MNQRRAELAQHYRTLLQHGEIQLPPEAGYAGPNHHLFVIRTGKRNDLKAFLSARGIETDVHYPRPIHLQPAYGHLRYSPGQFPVSEQCSQEVLSLPLYPALESSSIEEISHSIKEFFSRSSLR
jgi:dTDP-4-amino-4,6-dideoxygalactose transaminase